MIRLLPDNLRQLLRSKQARSIAAVLGLVGLVLVSSVSWSRTESFAALFLPPLDLRFEPADLCQQRPVTGIVVLGGGERRIIEAGKLARRLPNAKIVISGAGPQPHIQELLGSGIDPARITIEPNAKTTYENAKFTAMLVDRTPDERWLLLTSATHMPRAIGAFYKAGFKVEPWPVHDMEPTDPDAPLVAWHEWVGLGEYWLFGRSKALFPGRKLVDPADQGESANADACRDPAIMASYVGRQ